MRVALDDANPAGREIRELRGAAGAEALEVACEAIHRMAAEIQAERFLLERELFGVGPRCGVRQRWSVAITRKLSSLMPTASTG